MTIGGEYRIPETFFDSGIYLALGGYRLEGTALLGRRRAATPRRGSRSASPGEFKVNRWLGVLVELSGHYVDFDEAQLFAMGHGGVVFHF